MDPLTHTLTGAVLSAAGFKQKMGNIATVTLLAASIAPDIDYAARLWGREIFLKYHRGPTHSIIGIVIISLIIALIVRYFTSYPRLMPLFMLSLLGTSVHVLMDITTAYGTKVFYPFSDRWYAWDVVFIIDLWMYVVLFSGLLMIWRFKNLSITIASAVLILIILYWGVRLVSHTKAIDTLIREYPASVSYGAFPNPANPFRWHAVVEKDNVFLKGNIDVLLPERGILSALKKSDTTEIIDASKEARAVNIFLGFARYPYVTTEKTEDGFAVRWKDLRFDYLISKGRHFTAEAVVSDDGRILRDGFWF
ncbi:MAG: metal-dependent hydrolase [Nitrospirota bacterium]